jgi:two-component system chemotaxis response regulator CheY
MEIPTVLKILFIDDSPLMRQFVARSLAMTDFEVSVHHADCGSSGIAAARELQPDLIISDLNMPEMNGEEMVEYLLGDEVLSRQSVMILTADGERARAESLLRHANVMACLKKARTPRGLASAVRTFTARGRDARHWCRFGRECLVMSVDLQLQDSVSEVLSEMCFAAPEFVGEGTIDQPEGALIRFSGEISGHMKIAVDKGLAKQLAADFLGTFPEDVTVEQTRLFALELANVLCGTALSNSISGKQYQLGLPESTEVEGICPHCFAVAGGDADFGVQFEVLVH